MKEEGFVKSTSDNICEVIIKRKTACGENCGSCKGACKLKLQSVKARNDIGAKSGDYVAIEMDSKNVLLSAFLVYVLPLVLFLLSYEITSRLFRNTALTLIVSTALVTASFLSAMAYDRHHKEDFLSVVTEIIKKA